MSRSTPARARLSGGIRRSPAASSRGTLRRLGLAAGAALLAAAPAALAAPAAAHADYVSTSPEDGAVLEVPPAEASVAFDSGLLDAGAAFVVTAADGTVVSVEPAEVGERSLRVALQPDLAPGDYQAAFRVVSEDGHTVSDGFAFTVLPGAQESAAASPTPAATASSAPSAIASSAPSAVPSGSAAPGSTTTPEADGPPVGLVVAAAVLVLVGIAAVLLARGRRG